jgi:hypothetical protein
MQLTTTGEQTHRSGHLEQGCQMIYQIFIPKTPIWVCFGWPWYEKCWNILLLLGVFYDHTYVWCLYEFGFFFFFFFSPIKSKSVASLVEVCMNLVYFIPIYWIYFIADKQILLAFGTFFPFLFAAPRKICHPQPGHRRLVRERRHFADVVLVDVVERGVTPGVDFMNRSRP